MGNLIERESDFFWTPDDMETYERVSEYIPGEWGLFGRKEPVLVKTTLIHGRTGLKYEYTDERHGSAEDKLKDMVIEHDEREFVKNASKLFHALMAATQDISRWDIEESRGTTKFIDNKSGAVFEIVDGYLQPVALTAKEHDRFQDALRDMHRKYGVMKAEENQKREHDKLASLYGVRG